ncbi:LacI family DNA-binding transcriptional regulator [Actinoplanes sp. NPDC051470]|uniref:LacI family DNA-binding transcriptional regulator n=1 Tax=unclassified Actinoplanes TaxID=2626549 RepID=UPI0034232E16
MNDVARAAGVSLKTVSRVVNGEPTVAPALAARVHAAVASLHYRPHLAAGLLRRNDRRTGTIGLLLDDQVPAALHRAIDDEARTRGVRVLAARVPPGSGPGPPALLDGLIIAAGGADTRSFPDIPAVLVERRGTVDAVLATGAAGSRDAVRHLIARGHRHIAYLGEVASDRHRGYLAALGAAGLIAHVVRNPASAEHATLALLDGPSPPTALFTAQSPITIGAFRALRRRGAHGRVALVGFDDFPLADLLEPAVTVVDADPARMGHTAVRALFERIDGLAVPPREFWIPAILIPRGSGEIPP